MTQEARRFFSEGNPVQTDGMRLYSSMQEQHFPSFRVRTEQLLRFATVNSVVVVGSTATGKTTLEREIRAAHIDNISVPKKVITRDLRPDDNLEEVIPATAEEFSAMIDSELMGLYWERPMERERIASYGRLKPDRETIPVYFANNAVITNKASVKPASVLDTSLVLLVYAPRSIRSTRYHERSSEAIANHSEQAAFREAEHSLAPYLGVHVLIKNFGHYEEQALKDTVNFVRLVAQAKAVSL